MAELLCGGCCNNMLIPLTVGEYDQLDAAGTVLKPILHPPEIDEPGWDSEQGEKVIFEQLKTEYTLGNIDEVNFWFDVHTMSTQMNSREGLFNMPGRCALLGALNECTSYEARPAICKAFTPGSTACQAVVVNRDYPIGSVPVEIRSKPIYPTASAA